MTRRRYAQLTLAQVVLFGVATKPEELLEPRLRRIDELLDDDQLVDEIFSKLAGRWPQSRGRGRHSTPAEVVLRLLVLKHIKQWTYEQLEWEVTGNLGYRHFSRIGAEKVPDAKTMVRYGQLVDEAELKRLLERVVQLSSELGVTRGDRMRVDTTVVEADVRYPDGQRALCRRGARVSALDAPSGRGWCEAAISHSRCVAQRLATTARDWAGAASQGRRCKESNRASVSAPVASDQKDRQRGAPSSAESATRSQAATRKSPTKDRADATQHRGDAATRGASPSANTRAHHRR